LGRQRQLSRLELVDGLLGRVVLLGVGGVVEVHLIANNPHQAGQGVHEGAGGRIARGAGLAKAITDSGGNGIESSTEDSHHRERGHAGRIEVGLELRDDDPLKCAASGQGT